MNQLTDDAWDSGPLIQDLRDEIEGLKFENEILKSDRSKLLEQNSALRESNVDLIARNAQVEAENALLREDKARLDWLLEDVSEFRISARLWDIAGSLCPVDWDEAEDTKKWGRKAIDAARKEA